MWRLVLPADHVAAAHGSEVSEASGLVEPRSRAAAAQTEASYFAVSLRIGPSVDLTRMNPVKKRGGNLGEVKGDSIVQFQDASYRFSAKESSRSRLTIQIDGQIGFWGNEGSRSAHFTLSEIILVKCPVKCSSAA